MRKIALLAKSITRAIKRVVCGISLVIAGLAIWSLCSSSGSTLPLSTGLRSTLGYDRVGLVSGWPSTRGFLKQEDFTVDEERAIVRAHRSGIDEHFVLGFELQHFKGCLFAGPVTGPQSQTPPTKPQNLKPGNTEQDEFSGLAFYNVAVIGLPTLLVIPLLLGFPAAIWFKANRMKRRNRAGSCAHCGYDLRAKVESCPECGNVPIADIAAEITR